MPSGSNWAVVHIRGNHLRFGSKALWNVAPIYVLLQNPRCSNAFFNIASITHNINIASLNKSSHWV